ncbi:MAG TPA: FAD-dependent oxidoreductase, partial [Puia sp.]
MIRESFIAERETRLVTLSSGLVIVGGGIAGSCAAITAARAGIKVILVNDRPVLGGNASSEVRLWILGATSHMGNNNRWAREGGVIDEILVENTFRNPEGNPVIFDMVLLDKVVKEENITLLLNTSIYKMDKKTDTEITSVTGFCSQNSTTYTLTAPLFCDSSGDGIVAFLSGAAFRMGAEPKQEFGERLAPSEEYGELLGHSLYFYTKDTGLPVTFVPPSYALNDIKEIPRFRNFKVGEDGCRLWWIEYGGRLDTVHDTEAIKWELWKVVYGVWDHIKNSGEHPGAETLTLEWVGAIPGKRESRRFEGDYILRQQDVVEQRKHADAISFGGWALDLHPSDGVYSEKPGCTQYHSKGVYQIPYRCLYSRNISNLFLAGRIISASHVAFSSTRVMATCATTGQAVGMAAVLCLRTSQQPRDLLAPQYMKSLQTALLRSGQYIPHLILEDEEDLASAAHLSASSELELSELPFDGDWIRLDFPTAQMLPAEGCLPVVTVSLQSEDEQQLEVELRISSKPSNHTPDIILDKQRFYLYKGISEVNLTFKASVPQQQYAFICFPKNERVSIRGSRTRITGLLSVFKSFNKAVSNYGSQDPPPDIGVEQFEFWCPQRRPAGQNIAMRLSQGLRCFSAAKATNGLGRPVREPNAWVASLDDGQPRLSLKWVTPQLLKRVVIGFDTDFDQPM